MKMQPHLYRAIRFFTLLCVVAVFGAAKAHAGLILVSYSPASYAVTPVLPYTDSYVQKVTAPTGVQYPVTVNLQVTPLTIPLGDATTAASYVSFSETSHQFTGPGQVWSFTVNLNFPTTALSPDVPSGAYTYKVTTPGWPVPTVTDPGFSLSATVSLPTPPPGGNPPTVVINTPTDGATFNYQVTDLPATIPFSFDATTDSVSPPITSINAYFGTSAGMPEVAVTSTAIANGFNGSGTVTVSAPGTYTIQASATNGQTTTDTNTFTVNVSGPPPTVTISSPTPGAQYIYRQGDPDTVVAFSFTADTAYGTIKSLTAQVDGNDVAVSPTNLGTPEATGLVNLPYNAGGSHSVSVTATNDYGTATATSSFTINFVAPNPAISITAPTSNQQFTIAGNATTASVPYTFVTTVQNGFFVDSVSASLGNVTLNPTTTGLNTASSATSTGTINLPVGSYTLTASGGSRGSSATTSVSFVVKSALVPPSVVINTPPVGYTKAIVPSTTVSIPLGFTGTSNNAGGTISQLTATLDGTPLTVSSTTLGQQVATGTSAMLVGSAGTHHIIVTATDSLSGAGSATATRDFTITFLTSHQISGTVFFDFNGNGIMCGPDFGLGFITVKLLDSTNAVVGSTTTDEAGKYAFTGIYPGTYTIVATTYPGLIATTSTRQVVAMGSVDIVAAPIGYTLNFCAIQSMSANGNSLGYWKNNVSKAISGKSKGAQVPAATIMSYTNKLADFALQPFDGLTMKSALAIMSSNSSAPKDLLAKQLLPAEYNYENGAYLNGNATLTYVFVAWGEAVLQNANSLPCGYVLFAQGLFDDYNNTHGGVVGGGCGCWGGDDD